MYTFRLKLDGDMKNFCRLFLACLLSAFQLQGSSVEVMRNLELKVQLDEDAFTRVQDRLHADYAETLFQTDTYFETKEGRLKLREEKGKRAYFIRYERPDCQEAKQSNYLFYPVEDVDLFFSLFGDSLKEEIKVVKQRNLYFPKPYIRVHLDQVEGLGKFLEIEIILSKEVSLSSAETTMRHLQDWLRLDGLPKISHGYRELLRQSMAKQVPDERDLSYYKNQSKVFWVIAEDFPVANWKRYDVIPCLFVEQFDDGSYGIIQLDPTIAADDYQYTAWRKLIGQEYDFRAEVLLIDVVRDTLYTLQGNEISFDTLSRSSRLIDKRCLAPFAKSPSKSLRDTS